MILNGEQQSVRALQWSVRFLRNRTARESSQVGKAEAGLDSGEGSCPFPVQPVSRGSNRGFGCSFARGWRNGVRTVKSRSPLGTSLSCKKACEGQENACS